VLEQAKSEYIFNKITNAQNYNETECFRWRLSVALLGIKVEIFRIGRAERMIGPKVLVKLYSLLWKSGIKSLSFKGETNNKCWYFYTRAPH